jgi:hypothetical protein
MQRSTRLIAGYPAKRVKAVMRAETLPHETQYEQLYPLKANCDLCDGPDASENPGYTP